jgi:dTDP-4-amino-4,6-dideoxygalactose transaminase
LLVGFFDPKKTGIHRDELLLALRDSNIGASIHYRPLHGQPLYCRDGLASVPVTEWLAEQIMTLPISARMSLDDVDYVVHHLAKLIQRKA